MSTKDKKEEMVTIPKSKYINLLVKSDTLEALECGGVDNWEWYGESVGEYIKEFNKENDTKLEDFDDLYDYYMKEL